MRAMLLLLVICQSVDAAQLSAATMRLQISNIAVSQGVIRIAVYRVIADQHWQETPYRLMEISRPQAGKVAKLALKHMPEGQYAIKLYHDENDNGKLDFKDSGYPDEPFAFSQAAEQKKRVLSIKDAIIAFSSGSLPVLLALKK